MAFVKPSKLSEKTFFKSMNENLCGRNNFQYHVGGVFEPTDNMEDDWKWLYFTENVTATLCHATCNKPRICEVKPLGLTLDEKVKWSGFGTGKNFRTNKLLIVRELPEEEILSRLIEEKSPVEFLLMYNPPYEKLLELKAPHKKYAFYFNIHVLRRTDLTIEQKRTLIPKSWEGKIDDFLTPNTNSE